MIATPGWPPVGTDDQLPYYPEFYSPDEYSKETDRMLPESGENYNQSSSASTPSGTPKPSITQAPSMSLLDDIAGSQEEVFSEKRVDLVEDKSDVFATDKKH